MKYLKVVSLVLVALLVASCAAQLPQKDIDAANAIMSEAEAAKADVYAPTEYQAAVDAKAAMEAELAAQNAKQSGKDYKQLTELVKAYSQAATAAKNAATANAEAAKNDVATLLTDVQNAFNTVKAEAEAAAGDAKKAKKAKLDLNAINAQIANEEQAIAAASSANDSGDYATVKTILSRLKDESGGLQSARGAAGFTAPAAATTDAAAQPATTNQ